LEFKVSWWPNRGHSRLIFIFDRLDIIKRLREEELTQTQIGEKVGWTREAARNYVIVLDKR